MATKAAAAGDNGLWRWISATGRTSRWTLVAHIALGHIDWWVAGIFTAGVVPGSSLGAALADLIPPAAARRAFGWMLLAFAVWFLTHLPG